MRQLLFILIALFVQLISPAYGAEYPQRTIRMIIPFAPGGGSDVLGRVLAEKISVELGVSVIVENKPGASSIIGTDAVAKAAPDGYTILLTNSAISECSTIARCEPLSPV